MLLGNCYGPGCLVKSTLKVTFLKSHAQAVRRNPPRGLGPRLGGGVGHGHCQQKGQNQSLFDFFPFSQKISVKIMFLAVFAMFSTTRGQTSTWQCCCGVGGFSSTICRQCVRRDMPVTINCTNTSKSWTGTNGRMGGFLSWPPLRGVR